MKGDDKCATVGASVVRAKFDGAVDTMLALG